MAKRAAHEGTIYRHKSKGWAGVLQVGVTEEGRRIRRTVYGATQGEVRERLAELRRTHTAAPWADAGSGMRLGDFLTTWLRDFAAPRVRATTLEYYRRVLEPVRQELGGVAIQRLGPVHVQGLLRRLEEGGRSARGRQMVFVVLRTALRDAVRARVLAVNPLDALRRPRAPRPEIKALGSEDARRLLAAAQGDPLEALFVLLLGTGLRLGEALGLRWGDVDLEASTLHVRRALVETPGGAQSFAEPKTSKSRRRVDLPGFAIAALRSHREKLGALPHPTVLVFKTWTGEPLRRPNIHRRSWRPLLKRAGLPAMPLHALRHTYASLALANGVHPKIVQAALGHSSITLTLDTYSHVVDGAGQEAAGRLDALLRR